MSNEDATIIAELKAIDGRASNIRTAHLAADLIEQQRKRIAELEAAAVKPTRSLHHAIADAIRPYLGPGERVIFRDAFRWKDQDGDVLPNHFESYDTDVLAHAFDYKIVHDFNHVAVIKDKEPSNG